MRIAFRLCMASLLLLGCGERSRIPSSPSSDNELQPAVQPRIPCNSPRITASPSTVSRLHNTGPYNASFTVKKAWALARWCSVWQLILPCSVVRP